jgi:hypothetical protein
MLGMRGGRARGCASAEWRRQLGFYEHATHNSTAGTDALDVGCFTECRRAAGAWLARRVPLASW